MIYKINLHKNSIGLIVRLIGTLKTIFSNRKIIETFLIYEINDEFQALKVQFDGRNVSSEMSNSR